MDMYHRERALLQIKDKFQKGQFDKNGNQLWKGCPHCFLIVERLERSLRINQYSDGRILKYWQFLKRIHEMMDICLDNASKKDLEEFVVNLNSSEYEEQTKYDFKNALRFFYRWLEYERIEGDYPEKVSWIKPKIKTTNEKKPEHLFTQKELEEVAKRTTNDRDKALILVLYETGCRVGELLKLQFMDIQTDSVGCVLRVTGKTGARKVRVIEYSKEFYKWLDSHPGKKPENFVWVNLSGKHDVMKPFNVNQVLKKASALAGFEKKIHAHLLRHSRATHLFRKVPEAVMKQYFGWTKSSDMASVYNHLTNKDVDEVMLALHGVEAKEIENNKNEGRNCQRCGSSSPVYSHFCKKCNLPLDIEGIMEYDNRLQKTVDIMADFLVHWAEKDEKFKNVFVDFVRVKKAEELFSQT